MATSPEAFYDLFKNIKEYDGVIASRYVKGAIVEPKPKIQRIIVSRIFNFLVKILFFMPYQDTQCGAKIFKKTAIEKILPYLSLSQWAFDVNLLYSLRMNNLIVKEVPTI